MHCHGTDPWRNDSEKVGLPFRKKSKEMIFSRLKQMVEELRTKGVGVCNAARWIIAVGSYTVSGALQDHWQFSPTITTWCRSLSLLHTLIFGSSSHSRPGSVFMHDDLSRHARTMWLGLLVSAASYVEPQYQSWGKKWQILDFNVIKCLSIDFKMWAIVGYRQTAIK